MSKSCRGFVLRNVIFITTIIMFVSIQQCPKVESAKIICFYPIASKSHMNLFFPLCEALAQAGHQVTTLTPFKAPSKPHPNHEILVVTEAEEAVKNAIVNSDIFNPKNNFVNLLFRLPTALVKMHEIVMDTTYIEKFCLKELGEYDLAISNAVHNIFSTVCFRENGIPFIYFQTAKLDSILGWVNGVPMPYSYIPLQSTKFPSRMNLWQRTANTLANVLHFVHTRFYYLPLLEDAARRTLPVKDFPSFKEMERNVSLVFVNTHLAIDGALPRVPHVIDIGGIHCTPPKPLPKDLEDFVQGSGEHGFILFSLGSAIQGSKMPDGMRQTLLDGFAKLKQRVLWKFETKIQNVPPNVLISKWLPQQDLLGHPKCKLFITHGGMLSIVEATYHGVPLIGMPIWWDQGSNIMSAVEKGFAEIINFKEITENELTSKIHTIINNPSYYEKVKHLSSIFKDRPMNATATATYWVDYVLRYKGAPHLKNSASFELYTFQYFLLDVMLLIGLIVVLFLGLLYFLFKLCRRFIKRKSETNLNKKNN